MEGKGAGRGRTEKTIEDPGIGRRSAESEKTPNGGAQIRELIA